MKLFKINLKFKILFSLFLTSIVSWAQTGYEQLPVEYLSTKDGMLNNYVHCIHQDSKGFIWIGTKEGMNKFDGTYFTEYTHSQKDSTSLSSNDVHKILEDSYGNLWAGTSKGLNLMCPDQNSFTHYLGSTEQGNKAQSRNVSALFEDKEGNLWAGTGDGYLHLYDRAANKFISFSILGKAELRSIIDGPNNTLILGHGDWVLESGQGGITYFDKNKNQFLSNPLGISTTNLSIIGIVTDSIGNLWIGSYNSGLYKYLKSTRTLTKYEINIDTNDNLNSNLILGLYEDSNNIIWVSTDGGGVNWLDKKNDTFSRYQENISNTQRSGMAVTEVIEDQSGVFWVGTVSNGIIKHNKYKSKFEHIQYKEGQANGLGSKSVMALEESHNNGIWIGFDHGGLDFYNKTTRNFTHYVHNPKNYSGLGGSVINGLYESKNRKLYIGMFVNGFDIFDTKSERFTHSYEIDNAKDIAYVKVFWEDQLGNIWIGSRKHGLLWFNPQSETIKKIEPILNYSKSTDSNHISALLEENDSTLWVGTFKGLNLFDINSRTFRTWNSQINTPSNLRDARIWTLCKDKEGILWIGTDNGLNYYDESNDDFGHYSVKDGLPSNNIKGILTDDNHNLWLSTNRGISKFSLTNREFNNFGLEDGIGVLEFNENTALKTSDGKLYFGGTDGITSFYPEDIRSNTLVPPVLVTNLLIANKEVQLNEPDSPLQRHISDTKELILQYKQNVFTFEFVALNYTSSKQNEYAYMLEGFEREWNYVGNQRNATYTNINTGNYTFRVKASNNDGVWNEEGTSIQLTILPPWWKTNWAIFSYILLFVFATIALRQTSLYRLKLLNSIKLERMEKEKEHEINQAKLRFFTNISHEFKTPLTLILGPLEKIIDSETGNIQAKRQFRLMKKNANRLLRLINQLMDFRKVDLGKETLNASESDIVSFVKDIAENFKSLAEGKDIQLKTVSEFDQLNMWFDPEKLDMVLYNQLSNAFKFTKPAGSINISIRIPDASQTNGVDKNMQFVEISVQDTGKGIAAEKLDKIFERFYQVEKNQMGTGIGLSLSKSFMELHHGKIWVNSEPGKGTTFHLLLPLGKSHLSDDEVDHDKHVTAVQKVNHESIETNSVETKWANSTDIEHQHTILIVEDNLDMMTFLIESLCDSYSILSAKNGLEGLEKATQANPDLIVSDITMPEMDGIEFCEKIKTNLITNHIPVILLTARSSEEITLKGLKTGADSYMTKPFNLKILRSKIKNLIEVRRKLIGRFKEEIDISPSEMGLNSANENFMSEALTIVENHISDQDFNVESMLKELGVSRTYLFTKIKALSGQGPDDFIRSIRIKKAAKLLITSDMNISEIGLKIGYSSSKYFRINFKKHFGLTPSEFRKEHE